MNKPRRPKTYEVSVEGDGRSGIDAVFTEEAEAMERARFLLARAKFTLVQVARVDLAGREEVIFSKSAPGGGAKPPGISHIDDSEPCGDVWAVYGRKSRATLNRLLRAYWDEQVTIPTEGLHRHIPLRMLEREAMLFNPALSRLATLQAPLLGISVFARQDQLTALFERLKDLARDENAPVEADRALVSSGLAGLLDAAQAYPRAERERVVTHALSRLLDPFRDWNAKLDATLALLDGAGDGEAARVVDETLAEIVDGREPIQALIGYAPNLGTAVASILAAAEGRLDDRAPGTPSALRLSEAAAAFALPLTRAALYRRAAGALDGASPLSRAAPAEENALFAALLDRLRTPEGWRGGPEIAGALTRRAKVAGRAGADDLPFETAVDRLNASLQAASARVGYLLDLAETPFAKPRLSCLVERLGSTLEHVASVAEVAPPGMSETEARSWFERRLIEAEIPHVAAEGLLKRLPQIRDVQTEAVTLVRARVEAMVVTVGDKHFDVPRDGTGLVLGRGRDCRARVAELSVSRRHAKIEAREGTYVLTDTSRNGTTVILSDGRTVYLAAGESVPITDPFGEIRMTPDEDGPPRVRVTWRLKPQE